MKQIDMTLNNHNSHTNHTTSSGDDLGSTDEVKVFKDEGDREDEKISSENLLEEKSSLIDLTESEFISYQEKNGKSNRSDHSSLVFGKVEPPPPNFPGMGYFVSPYASYAAAANSGTKIGLPPFFHHNNDTITSPPPAHCGIPPYQFDPTKTLGLPRPPLYPFTASQYPYLMLSPEMSQVAAASAWHHAAATAGPTIYPTAATTFRTPAGYPSTLPISTNDFSLRFSPNLLSHTPPHHVMNTAAAAAAVAAAAASQQSAIVTSGPKQDIKNHQDISNHHQFIKFNSNNSGSGKITVDNHQLHNIQHHHQNSLILQQQHQQQQQQQQQHHQQQHNQHHQKINSQSGGHNHGGHNQNQASPNDSQDNNNDKGKPHIKKPLNAFMLYMKEMRSKVVAECTLKESAAINQILGQRWHALGREEQAKYYEMARRERQLHMQMYPDWSSRTNITRGKKRKRKQDITNGNNSMKKCRARFGLDQQNQWCKPCRRKKKCIRYMETDNENNNNNNNNNKSDDNHNLNLNHHQDDDNLGSCGSTDEAKTPEDDTESFNQSISSPGGFSGLSSLQSPSTSVASPLNFLASPATPSNLLHGNNHLLLEQQPIKSQHHNQLGLTSALTSNNNNNNNEDKTSLMNINSTTTAAALAAATKSSLSSITSHLSSINVQSPRPSSNENSISNSNSSNQIQHAQPSLSSSSSTSSSKSASSTSFTDSYFDKIMPNATRSPIGANPRDINNPLSINQLTKRDYTSSNSNNNNISNLNNHNNSNSNSNSSNNPSPSSLYPTSTMPAGSALTTISSTTNNNNNNNNNSLTTNPLDLFKESQLQSPSTSSPSSSSPPTLSSSSVTSSSLLPQLPHHQSSLLNTLNSIKQPLPPPPSVSLSNFLADISQHNLHNLHHQQQQQQQLQQLQLQQQQQQQQNVTNSFIQHLQQQQLQLHLQQQQQQQHQTSLLLNQEQQQISRLQPK